MLLFVFLPNTQSIKTVYTSYSCCIQLVFSLNTVCIRPEYFLYTARIQFVFSTNTVLILKFQNLFYKKVDHSEPSPLISYITQQLLFRFSIIELHNPK